MIRGVDTTFLVEAEVAGHPNHRAARAMLDDLLAKGDTLALAPQVLAEYVHIVTDSKRFLHPLTMPQALDRARIWWDAQEVVRIFPDPDSSQLFLQWMAEHKLGRKRLLDTLLAATFYSREIRSILSSNARDYAVFGCFEILVPE
jgi:predicted nucleic acid-binding protein